MQVVGRIGLAGVVVAFALFVGVSTANAGVVQLTSGCLQSGTATTTAGGLTLAGVGNEKAGNARPLHDVSVSYLLGEWRVHDHTRGQLHRMGAHD